AGSAPEDFGGAIVRCPPSPTLSSPFGPSVTGDAEFTMTAEAGDGTAASASAFGAVSATAGREIEVADGSAGDTATGSSGVAGWMDLIASEPFGDATGTACCFPVSVQTSAATVTSTTPITETSSFHGATRQRLATSTCRPVGGNICGGGGGGGLMSSLPSPRTRTRVRVSGA